MQEIDTGIFITNNTNNNIYIIGDLHGDYQCLLHCLVDLCKSCNITKIYNDGEFKNNRREYIEWEKNNNSVIVFCGDLIHRQRFPDHILDDECSDIYIIKTLLRLKKEAIKYGGNIIIIAGNHEIMNIVNVEDDTYLSPLNKSINNKYFKDNEFINEYVLNSYAWIKLNDILLAHGGLCSDYLNYLNDQIDSKKIISYVNDKYRSFFKNFIYHKHNLETYDKTAFDLFINYDIIHKSKHNIFWCREWGYGKINVDKLKSILNKVNCSKMIISHCPQFLSPDTPKMINFECIDCDNNKEYLLARIDLGMSRSFDYNKEDKFFYYLSNNYNRKISILKLLHNKSNPNNLYFNNNGIITYKLSCIQYLLLKYGKTIDEWNKYNIKSNWIGFNHIDNLLKNLNNNNNNNNNNNLCDVNDNKYNSNNVLLCLLYQIHLKNIKLRSIDQFRKFY